ncbi:MAG: hypothetical protein FWF46_08475 [Oscillospiraceae bacterium]|nr:hypothetical protein [Oscillospiraceae bacterium]
MRKKRSLHVWALVLSILVAVICGRYVWQSLDIAQPTKETHSTLEEGVWEISSTGGMVLQHGVGESKPRKYGEHTYTREIYAPLQQPLEMAVITINNGKVVGVTYGPTNSIWVVAMYTVLAVVVGFSISWFLITQWKNIQRMCWYPVYLRDRTSSTVKRWRRRKTT